jgi:hypothetical protein
MKKPAESVHPAFVDRIEGEVAVLLLGKEGKQTLSLPRAYLPPGAGEGSYLQLRLVLDPRARARAEKDVAGLMADLLGQEAPGDTGGGEPGSRL